MALVATLLVLTILFLRSYTSAIGWVRRSNDIRMHVGRALSLLADAETAQRGFLLLGEPSALEPYRHARSELPAELAVLRSLAADDSAQQRRIGELQRLAGLRFGVIDETIAVRERDGVAPAAELVRSGRGTSRMADIRRLVSEMEQHETAQLEARTAHAHRRDQLLTGTLMLLIAFAAVFMGAVLWSKNHELEERRRASAERERLIGALERSNRDLDQFAYVASHDLKAPLRGIANLAQWLREDLGSDLTRDVARQLQLMRVRVHRMEALIEGILDYSRAGRATQLETVDTGRLFNEVIELIVPPPGAVVEVPRTMPVLRTERAPLQQVFMNLVGNALKHAGRPDPRVTVWAREGDRFDEFSVSDNGPGIAAAYHEKIWAIFQTLETRDRVEGTGIGLAVVKKIVEARGGRAWVESAEGAGASFHFLWPRREQGGEIHG
jgi:signal transduction histidine kinase